MARASSKSSGRTGNPRRKNASNAEDTAPETVQAAQTDETQGDSPQADPTGAEAVTPAPETAEAEAPLEEPAAQTEATQAEAPDAPTDPQEPAEPAELPEPTETAPETAPETAAETQAPPPPAAPPQAPAKGPGVVPLILGGVIAAGIGYGAAYMGWLPSRTATPQASEAALSAAIAPLQDQISALNAAMPQAAAPADLTPVLDQIAALTRQTEAVNDGLSALTARVAELEARPTAAPGADTAGADAAGLAATQAITAELEATLEAERAAAEARAAELQEEAQAAARQAEAARAALAEVEAQAATQEARGALGQVEAAMATGAPFADALARIATVTEPPEALSAVAETGLPTRAALQDDFPALARAALPVALQETAGEGMGDRLSAFVMGQIGGRSVAPRDGDDPDAILSRVEAAVRAGDLPLALTEIAALPDGARAVLAPWVADVEARIAAEAGLATLSAALAANGN